MRSALLRLKSLNMLTPELSIVIPTLNEAEALPLLLADLSCQQDIILEVIVADGGSADATCQLADGFFNSKQLLGSCLVGESGRGGQLNAGAAVAKSDWLLFLHADSRLDSDSQLRDALDFMCEVQRWDVQQVSAGRFPLSFDVPENEARFGLYFYETKARLGRPGCIHGDQGMLLSKASFREVGPFREDLPVMEDTTLAEAIRANGQWLLLPGTIVTSARRFQAEGLKARQTLNALMMNFFAIGWMGFFTGAPGIYRQQDRTQPLQLLPFFLLIKDLFSKMPRRKRWKIWMATGGYVRSQAWQFGLALDCRKAYLLGREPGHLSRNWLNWFDRWFEPLTNHCIGRILTALLVRAWFAWQLNCK